MFGHNLPPWFYRVNISENLDKAAALINGKTGACLTIDYTRPGFAG